MYILDKIFIHVNNEIYTGVINLCVGDRRSRYNNCYRLSFSDNNKLAIKKIVTMSLCCQRAQSSHGKMFHTILLSTCDGETVYSNQAKTPQYNSNSMKKHVYQSSGENWTFPFLNKNIMRLCIPLKLIITISKLQVFFFCEILKLTINYTICFVFISCLFQFITSLQCANKNAIQITEHFHLVILIKF